MGWLAVGLMGMGMLQDYGASQQAGAMNAQAAARNAEIARIQAAQVLELADEDVRRMRIEEDGILGAQQAAFAGQNIDLGSDIVQKTNIQTQMIIDDEIATVENNARLKSWGYLVQAQQDVTSGQRAQALARSQATGALVSGASNIALTVAQINRGVI